MSFIRQFAALLAAAVLCLSASAFAAQTPIADTPSSKAAAAENNPAKININNADAKQLEDLKGIGSAKAQAIIEYRTQHGAFKSVNELASVKGFSEKALATILKNNPERIVLQ